MEEICINGEEEYNSIASLRYLKAKVRSKMR